MMKSRRGWCPAMPLTLALLLAAAPLSAQGGVNPADVKAIKPGQVQIIGSYLNANGKLVSDTILLTVQPPAIATIALFNQINPSRWVSTTTVGKSFCAYASAVDSSGNLLTGRKMVFTSSDTTVAKISVSSVCPDTSVDMSKILTLPLPPFGSLSSRR